MATPTINILALLDQCPPFLCYYGAHYGLDKRPTLRQLIKSSGMSARTFTRITTKTSWAGITIRRAAQFQRACGIDVMHPDAFLKWIGEQISSENPFKEFDDCGGARDRMIAHFNLLASEAVLAREQG